MKKARRQVRAFSLHIEDWSLNMDEYKPPAPSRAAFGSIPTREQVFAAAALLPPRPRWTGREGPTWRVTVTPGGIRLGTKDYNRLNRSAEAATARRLSDNPGMTVTVPKRSTISNWSAKSR